MKVNILKNRIKIDNTTIPASNSEKKDVLLSRDQILQLSSQTIRQLHDRVSGERFKEQNGDTTRLAYIRALSQLLQIHAALLKDTEITEMEDRLAVLERQRESGYQL